MKKLLAVILPLLLLLSFAACRQDGDKDDGGSTVQDKYNLAEYMKKGEIPEAEFTLGMTVEDIKSHLESSETGSDYGHNHAEYYEDENTANRSDYIAVGEVLYYYEAAKAENGISSIVCQVNAFGFEASELTGKSDIKNAFPSMKYTEREVTNAELYFIPVELEGVSAITYTVDNYRLDFFFMEDSLLAVNLVDTNYWTLT